MEVRSLAKVAACAIERAATRDRPKVSGGGGGANVDRRGARSKFQKMISDFKDS